MGHNAPMLLKLDHPKVKEAFQKVEPIVIMGFGSTIYGTALPTSDTDLKGIFLPYGKDIVLGKAPSTITIRTNDSGSGVRNSAEDIDLEIFSLYRYLELLAQGQTVALDMLFCPQDFIFKETPGWLTIKSFKDKLVNKKCGAAIGYATAQANKYSLRGHRMLALEEVLDMLEPYYKDHPRWTLEEALDKIGFVEAYSASDRSVVKCYHLYDKLSERCKEYVCFPREIAPHIPQGYIEYLEVCGKKAGLTASVKFAYEVFRNELSGYGDRAKAAKEGGADWKAMYHAVRIAEQTQELMLTGHITFPRPEAPYLLKIRRGEVRVDEVSRIIEQGIEKIKEAQAKSTLREEADRKWIEQYIYDVYFDRINNTRHK